MPKAKPKVIKICVVIGNVYVKNPNEFIPKINKNKENRGTK